MDLIDGASKADGVGGVALDDGAGCGAGCGCSVGGQHQGDFDGVSRAGRAGVAGADADGARVADGEQVAQGFDLVDDADVGAGAAGDGGGRDDGADVGGVVGLDGEDAGGGGEVARSDAGGADERGGAGVGGDAYVLKDEGADEKVVEVVVGGEGAGAGGGGGDAGRDGQRAEEGEVDGGHRHGGRAEGRTEEADVLLLLVGDLVDDVLLGGGEGQRAALGTGADLPGGDAADGGDGAHGVFAGVACGRCGVGEREALAGGGVEVELGLEVFEVEGEVQDVGVAVRGSRRAEIEGVVGVVTASRDSGSSYGPGPGEEVSPRECLIDEGIDG